ncbi:hypothetical protein JO388_06585 [Streptococcus suis]|uniref:hypothetical protein n=1 Tax=Streptococcus suis TaxID=1307 RepID=UPI00195F5BEE|nr:hypothetical protein [Streptococcus suis]MBM7153017.1 hypothetical protein [Streptococcus suis]MBM7179948.1 hypothetical protein [Streptococcus suis]MDG4502812.1 hypothetical protein [Streptococcus suis]
MAIGGAATGAIISGYDGYTSGKRGWELVGAIGQGAGAGASVRAIEQSDNRGSGSSMGYQLRPFDNGTKVYIDIVD